MQASGEGAAIVLVYNVHPSSMQRRATCPTKISTVNGSYFDGPGPDGADAIPSATRIEQQTHSYSLLVLVLCVYM
jgi:hypothetical protein